MSKKSILFAASTSLTTLFLTACSSNEVYTVDYLMQEDNSEVLAEVLEDCKENNQTENNCKNANEAQSRIEVMELEKRMVQ